jgi:acyl carrier protein
MQSFDRVVISIVANVTNRDEQTLSSRTSLADLGLDSLSLTTIVSLIESTYGCEAPIEQVLELYDAQSVGDLIQVANKITEGARKHV